LFSACLSPSVCIRRRRRRSGRYSESFISSKLPFRLGDHDDATGIAAYAMGSTVIATPAEPNQSALRDAAIDVFRELVDAVAKVKENHKHLALNSRARDHEVSKKPTFSCQTDKSVVSFSSDQTCRGGRPSRPPTWQAAPQDCVFGIPGTVGRYDGLGSLHRNKMAPQAFGNAQNRGLKWRVQASPRSGRRGVGLGAQRLQNLTPNPLKKLARPRIGSRATGRARGRWRSIGRSRSRPCCG
jgi:hypothetical protein